MLVGYRHQRHCLLASKGMGYKLALREVPRLKRRRRLKGYWTLLKMPLATNGPVIFADDRAKRVGTDVILPAFDENTIIVEVMSRE